MEDVLGDGVGCEVIGHEDRNLSVALEEEKSLANGVGPKDAAPAVCHLLAVDALAGDLDLTVILLL